MHRRTALELTATGLLGATGAGCLAQTSLGRDDPSDGIGRDDPVADEPSGEDALYALSAEPIERAPAAGLRLDLAFDVGRSFVTEDDPATLEFTLHNDGDEPIEVSAGAPWPFGVLWLEGEDRDENEDEGSRSVPLWTDAYEGSGHVGTDGRTVTGVDDIALLESLPGGGSVTETYELHHDAPGLAAGTYRLRVAGGARRVDVSDGYSMTIEVVVEEGTGRPEGSVTVSTEHPDDGHPPTYGLTVWEVEGGDSTPFGELPPAVRRELADAVARGRYRSYGLPSILEADVHDDPVEYGGRHFRPSVYVAEVPPDAVGDDWSDPLDLHATLADGELVLSLTNVGTRSLELRHHGEPFFGVLTAFSADTGEHLVLEHDAYRENDAIVTDDGPVRAAERDVRRELRSTTALEPGESIEDAYAVLDAADAEYAVRLDVEYVRDRLEYGVWTLTFAIAE